MVNTKGGRESGEPAPTLIPMEKAKNHKKVVFGLLPKH
jgi:hypothetical protein